MWVNDCLEWLVLIAVIAVIGCVIGFRCMRK